MTSVRAGIAAVALAIGAAGASGCGEAPSRAAPPPDDTPAVTPDAKEVRLRAELTSLVGEHVFLTADAVRSGERAGFDSALHDAAKRELEAATEKLADELSPLIGEDVLLDELRRHLEQLTSLTLDYGHDQVDPAFSDAPFREEIAKTRAALVTLLAQSSDQLRSAAIAEQLELVLGELLRGLNQVPGDERGQQARVASAAERGKGLAGLLAVAVADAVGGQDARVAATSEAARLAADLRALLEEGIHLSFGAVQIGFAEGFESPAFQTASSQVDEGAKHFGDRLATIPHVGSGEVELPPAGAPGAPAEAGDDVDRGTPMAPYRVARDLLRRHWQLVQLYAREAAGDVPGLDKKAIEERLNAVTTDLAGLLAGQTTLTRTTLFDPLGKADEELLKAIDALVAGEAAAYEHLATSLDHAADAADVLTDGVLRVQQER